MILFVDTETLGLDPDRHVVWEVAAVVYDPANRTHPAVRSWQLPVSDDELAAADPVALRINRFEDRRADPDAVTSHAVFCAEFLALCELAGGSHQAVWAGAVPSFDEERLRRLLARHGHQPAWHYHLLDVETYAVAHLNHDLRTDPFAWPITLPVSSAALNEALDLPPVPDDVRHTAMGDVLWAITMWEACQ